jgi:predicted transcriptional regulator
MKILKITFESLDQFMARSSQTLVRAAKNKEAKLIREEHTLIWASVEAYQQFMSDQKYAILAAIAKFRPQSVYQLAKILNRAQQNVARDCDLLEGHGFIRYVESAKGRKKKAPRLAFEYAAIQVCLPALTYRVELPKSA